MGEAAQHSGSGATMVEAREDAKGRFLELFSCVRWSEVLVLQGPPLLGLLFSTHKITAAWFLITVLFAAGSVLLVAHVFVLNDWTGMKTDLQDPNRRRQVFTYRGISQRSIGFLSVSLLTAGLLLLSIFGPRTLTLALSIVVLSALYSFTRVHLKGIPVINSALHFLAGLLHFLLGYSIFAALDLRGIEIGCFFALVFVAGHLTHETRDSDADGLNGIRTNAVAFGRIRCFVAGLILFATANVWLMLLALLTVIPRPLALLILILPLHIYWSLRTIYSGLTFVSVQRFRDQYRVLYGLMGAIMAAVLIMV